MPRYVNIYVCMYVCMHACMYVCITCITFMYACMHVCMYVSTSAYNHRCLRHSSVYVSDLKIEVTFPRPGDTLVPPGPYNLEASEIQVPQTNSTNIVCIELKSARLRLRKGDGVVVALRAAEA